MDRIEPRIHDEIKDYKERFYGFTLRQWIFAVVILIATVPTYLFLSPVIGENTAGWLVIIIALPLGFVGFIPIQNMNAEKLLFFWKRNYINFAKPLIYKTEKELELEKNTKKSKVSNSISKHESKSLKKAEKIKAREIKLERKKERELTKAKKLFVKENAPVPSISEASNFNLTQEEARILLKLAQSMVEGKEKENVNENTEGRIEEANKTGNS